MIDIIEYQDQYAGDFKRINLEWLDKFNLTEDPDLLMLNRPRETILKPGGAIFLAKTKDEIIGSAALISGPRWPLRTRKDDRRSHLARQRH